MATEHPQSSHSTPWSWLPGPVFSNITHADPSLVRSRKLWGGEVLFSRAALQKPGRADVMIRSTIAVPSTHPLTHAHVRCAFRKLRFEHPSIASKIMWNENHSDAKFVYEAPQSEAEVERWLDDVVSLREATAQSDVDGLLKAELQELGRLDAQRTSDELKLYHLAPSSSSSGDRKNQHIFLLYLRHTTFDGIGSWEAMGCFLSELAKVLASPPVPQELAWGTEFGRLARTVPDRVSQDAQWTPKDLHGNWPLVKRVKEIIARPPTCFGIPYPSTTAPQVGMEYFGKVFPPSTLKGLLAATRQRKVKLFATQFAMNLITCMRVSPPPLLPPTPAEGDRDTVGEDGEHRITLSYNAVNLRPTLSTQITEGAGGVPEKRELVSAIGFNTLDARDLMRFRSVGGDNAGVSDRETLDAIWTLAREIQAQLTEQAAWDKDITRCVPAVLGVLAGSLKTLPPKYRMQTPQIINTGALDSIIKHSYPIPPFSPSSPGTRPAEFQVLDIGLHNVILHFAVHTYTWGGELHHSYNVPTSINGHMEEGRDVVDRYTAELERITALVAADVQASPDAKGTQYSKEVIVIQRAPEKSKGLLSSLKGIWDMFYVESIGESSMMDPNGYIFALFSAPYSTLYNPTPCIPSQCKSLPPRIAVDAFGLVWRVSEADFHALRAMAESTRIYAAHDWSTRVSYTCQPSQAIILPSDGEKTGYVRVYTHAFNTGTTSLVEPVTLANGVTYTTFPQHIIDLLSIVYQRTWGATFGPMGEAKWPKTAGGPERA
ncbi:hypothetical protein HWV62_5955 [Athelia sp. TMB]|nr:hypothetical protein HWV62_5955 [Athelia sp. TMB]